MIAMDLEKMIHKFEKTRSFDVQSGRGRQKKKCSRSVKEVITAVQESSSGVQVCSAREIAEH